MQIEGHDVAFRKTRGLREEATGGHLIGKFGCPVFLDSIARSFGMLEGSIIPGTLCGQRATAGARELGKTGPV